MKKHKPSIDGFIPRRSGNKQGLLHSNDLSQLQIDNSEAKPLHTVENDDVLGSILGDPEANRGLGRTDIEDTLSAIDNMDTNNQEPVKKLSRWKKRRLARRQAKRPKSLVKRIVFWVITIAVLAALSAAGYFAYKFINASGNVFQGNILDVFTNQPLKQDANGRSNFLLLGTSEDDKGHDGAYLTDSMMIVSVDQTNKNVYMISIPRDLYVDYGMACPAGYRGKINAYFSCADTGETAEAEQNRLSATQKLVGDIFGLTIQYGVHVNHTVIKQAVDAVGGVDVDIQGSNGAPGILDRNFDWRCNYTCYLVKYDNGVHHLDGEHALFLSMARGDVAPTYGLANSNFDREINQQKIIMALKDKATSVGILTNLGAINGLIDSLGDNLRTNIQTSEIKTLLQIASEVKNDDIKTLSLVSQDSKSVVTTGNINGASVVIPSAGAYNYDELQEFISTNLSSNPVVREAAPIVVLNGTNQAGYGQQKADELEAADYVVEYVDNAPAGDYTGVEIYQIGEKATGTARALSELYGVEMKTTTPPVFVNYNVQFVIIFGDTASSS
jgi:LCP family protein required for cell wall assembly